ncbi:hypothetical protein Tco_0972745 [Tanacetum coccineum]
MLDYGFKFMNTNIYIDNESTICIVKNPVYHSKTKHIAIRHHFIRDAYEKKLIQVLKIHTNDNVADLLTKAFDVSRSILTICDEFQEVQLGFKESLGRDKDDKQLMNVPVPLDHFPVHALTSKVFSFMVKKGKHFLGKVTPLFASMLVQPTEDEGATLERPSEPQPTPSPPHPNEANVEPQSDPSPRPSPTTHIPDSIPEDSGGNQGGQSSSDRSLSGNEGDMTLQSVYDLCISLCTQGRKSAKVEPSVHKDQLFNELADDTLDYMETKDAQDVGRTRDVVNEEKEIVDDEVSTKDAISTAQQKVSTDKENVSTDRPNVCTDRPKVSTDKEKDSTVSPDEGTILLNMRQAKAVSREKDKGVELKDVEETGRPRPTSTRSLLTLKPLPKIDPKGKGKKKIEEEDESDTESEGIPEAEKKFKQLARDEEMARKVQEDWEAEEETSSIKTSRRREREQFTVEERAKFLHATIAAQRRFLAEQRAAAIRNRPPTRT